MATLGQDYIIQSFLALTATRLELERSVVESRSLREPRAYTPTSTPAHLPLKVKQSRTTYSTNIPTHQKLEPTLTRGFDLRFRISGLISSV
jgi:hypothetical protein